MPWECRYQVIRSHEGGGLRDSTQMPPTWPCQHPLPSPRHTPGSSYRRQVVQRDTGNRACRMLCIRSMNGSRTWMSAERSLYPKHSCLELLLRARVHGATPWPHLTGLLPTPPKVCKRKTMYRGPKALAETCPVSKECCSSALLPASCTLAVPPRLRRFREPLSPVSSACAKNAKYSSTGGSTRIMKLWFHHTMTVFFFPVGTRARIARNNTTKRQREHNVGAVAGICQSSWHCVRFTQRCK